MSIKVRSRIWEHAPYEGGSLLVLLALADFCDDQGMCFPDQPSIAAKARLTDRQVRTVLAKLREDGEILMVPGRGRGNRTWYCVLSGLSPADREKKRKALPEIITGNKNRKSEEKRKSDADKSGSLRQEKRKFDALSEGSSEQQDASNPSPIRHDPSCDPSGGGARASHDASPTPPKRTRTERKPRPRDLVFESLAEATGIDWNVCEEVDRHQLNQVAAKLRETQKKPDAEIADDVRYTESYYRRTDWRGKQGERITLKLLRSLWGAAMRERRELQASTVPSEPPPPPSPTERRLSPKEAAARVRELEAARTTGGPDAVPRAPL